MHGCWDLSSWKTGDWLIPICVCHLLIRFVLTLLFVGFPLSRSLMSVKPCTCVLLSTRTCHWSMNIHCSSTSMRLPPQRSHWGIQSWLNLLEILSSSKLPHSCTQSRYSHTASTQNHKVVQWYLDQRVYRLVSILIHFYSNLSFLFRITVVAILIENHYFSST